MIPKLHPQVFHLILLWYGRCSDQVTDTIRHIVVSILASSPVFVNSIAAVQYLSTVLLKSDLPTTLSRLTHIDHREGVQPSPWPEGRTQCMKTNGKGAAEAAPFPIHNMTRS